jgi:hypothetical protein
MTPTPRQKIVFYGFRRVSRLRGSSCVTARATLCCGVCCGEHSLPYVLGLTPPARARHLRRVYDRARGRPMVVRVIVEVSRAFQLAQD